VRTSSTAIAAPPYRTLLKLDITRGAANRSGRCYQTRADRRRDRQPAEMQWVPWWLLEWHLGCKGRSSRAAATKEPLK
jgi:hypothetical protein